MLIRHHQENIIKLKNYVSKISLFINHMKEQNPNIEEGQQYGHSLLWDKTPIQISEKEIDKMSKKDQISNLYTRTPDNNY